MKYLPLILIPLLLILASCTQYRYDITYEKCNGQTGSISYNHDGYPILDGEQHKIWTSDSLGYKNYLGVNNVCDFSYTRNEIK